MLSLRHAAGYLLFLIDDAQCIREGAGGRGTGRDAPAVDRSLNSPPLISVALFAFLPR